MNNRTDRTRPVRNNLFAQFFSRLLIPMLVAFLLASFGTVLIGYTSRQKESHQYRQQTMQSFATSLSKPLWDCDNTTAQGILEALVNQPSVISGKIEELCQKQRMTAGPDQTKKCGNLMERSRITYMDEFNREHELGTLEVAFLKPSISGTLLEVLWQYFLLFSLLLAVLLLSTLKIFRQLISIPLANFQAIINGSGDAADGVALLDKEIQKRNDELGDVMIAFNELVRELANVIDKLHQNEISLSEMARRDPLTGLGNRLVLEEELTRALARSQRSGRSGCVLLFDLDGFKPVNDQYGHEAGDLVLQQTARRIQSVVRTTDTVVRLGGDEFVLIAENMEGRQAIENLVNKLTGTVAEPIQYNEHTLQIGVSTGVAVFPDEGESSTALLAKADREMYRAKRKNRDVQTGEPVTD